ncbi:MAG TPA: heme exporter protein CcmB [Dehalococcoidia bacterium]|nr:heme exporter protein CcmB [Dehalococcoidia bacterium]
MDVYWAILAKDLRTELRIRQTVVSTLIFSLLVLVVFQFSFDLRGADLITLAPGVLWSTFLFNGVLVLGRTFATEREQSTIEALAMSPIDRGLIFAAKWSLSLLLMLVTEAVVLVVFSAMFNTAVLSPLIFLDALLASAGFAAAGTSLAVITFNSRAREVMLPLLLLPLTVPVIIAAVQVTALALAGGGLRAAAPWLNLLGAFDILFGAVCYYSFGALLEE